MLRDAQKFRIKQFLYNPRHGFVLEDPDDNKEIDFLSKFLKYCNYVSTFSGTERCHGKRKILLYIHLSKRK